MKFILLLALATTILGSPVPEGFPESSTLRPGVIPILKKDEVRDQVGQYSLEYISGDGTQVREQGVLKPGAEGAVFQRKGSYKYTSPEGRSIETFYTADEKGFHVEGDHLPKA